MKTKYKISITIFSTLIVVFMSVLIFDLHYVKFIPLEMNVSKSDNAFSFKKSLLDDKLFHSRIMNIFDLYKIDYKKKDDGIYIPYTVSKNKEYLSNLTKKAQDEEWLKKNEFILIRVEERRQNLASGKKR